ncbi:MAG TPA: DUF5703 domain-containing protein [Candidatus Sulfotelmatobacter sp.]|nr:DUF5703 domain-containing protein [Candidatus Sulfotelmatobacter sp.]
MKSRFALLALLPICFSAAAEQNVLDEFVVPNDVAWSTLGTNENDSMPVGNGDIAANIWTEQNGDLVLLLAKSDAWTEVGKLVKLGRVRVHLESNPFAGTASFSQVLELKNGSVEIKTGANSLRVWVDANHPVVHIEAVLENPVTAQAGLELWRTNSRPMSVPSPDRGGLFEYGGHFPKLEFEPDTIFPATTNGVTWCHFNQASVYPVVFQQEHLESLLAKYPDPLLHRCFGAEMTGAGLTNLDDQTLKSSTPIKNFRLDLVAFTQPDSVSTENWKANLDLLISKTESVDVKPAWQEHESWWSNFWDRSWIHVTGTPEAVNVSQGYLMQRYMMACSSRGAFPVKFNGGLFTVGDDVPDDERDSNKKNHNPDFREWGNSYWNQNNRLLYWPLVATGDFDLLEPWFGMYLKALPLAKDRTQIYFHHAGASLPETMLFWGLPNLNDFGWNNTSNELQSPWQRYHIQGTLEVIAQMLDAYDCTQDPRYAGEAVPFADAIITYYADHWPRDPQGKIRMTPVQSLETYQLDAVNPTPDIAGLKSVIPRLLELPHKFTSSKQRDFWKKTLGDLPPISLGKTSNGKLPPDGLGDSNGLPTILPAEKYGSTKNGENPELYVAFPYRLYGVGKPDLKLAQDTFAARRFHFITCWGQDGTESSILGLTGEAKKAVTSEFTDYGDERFPWFWKAGGDWIPDLDNGGSGMITLQNMLMQCDGRRIRLLPAWPGDWSADFKLHAPYQTTVEGHVENGKLTRLQVMPKSRAGDVIISN